MVLLVAHVLHEHTDCSTTNNIQAMGYACNWMGIGHYIVGLVGRGKKYFGELILAREMWLLEVRVMRNLTVYFPMKIREHLRGGIGGSINRKLVNIQDLLIAGIHFADVIAAIDPRENDVSASIGVRLK